MTDFIGSGVADDRYPLHDNNLGSAASFQEEGTMGFVQIIEYQSSKIDEMQKLGNEWEAAAAGQRRAGRRVLCADRDNQGKYFNIVFFDSYEDAMANSNLPVTQEFSQKMAGLVDSPPTFHNLDVIEDRQ